MKNILILFFVVASISGLLAQNFDEINHADIKSSPIAIMKFEKIGMECENKKGKPKYCDNFVESHDKSVDKYFAKQKELLKDLKLEYELVTHKELQEDQHSDNPKHRFAVSYTMVPAHSGADNAYVYEYDVWDNQTDTDYKVDLGQYFGTSKMSSYKALIDKLNELAE